MNILVDFRGVMGQYLMHGSKLREHHILITRLIKDDNNGQLYEELIALIPEFDNLIFQTVLQLAQSYFEEIDIPSIRAATMDDIRLTMTLCRSFSRLVMGTNKWA